MRSRGKHNVILQRAAILVISCAGLLTATLASGESYQEALEEAERESPHQHERMQDPRREALEESERESPHQRELEQRSRSPYEEALQENQQERP
jgi:hypothetical protein